MPDLLDEAFAAVGEKLEERLDLVRARPRLPRPLRRRLARSTCTPTPTRWRPRSGGACGPRRPPRATGELRELADRALPRRDRRASSARNLDSPLGLLGPDLARLARARRVRPARAAGRPLPARRAAAADLLLPGPVRRACRPQRALGAYGVIAYMDTVAGVYFPRGGMRTVGAALADAAAAAGARDPLRADGDRAASARGGRVTAVRHRAPTEPAAAPSALACDAVVLTAGPAGRARAGRPAPRGGPCRCGTSPSAVVLHAGLRDPRPDAAHHTISFGAAWERRSPRSSTRAG